VNNNYNLNTVVKQDFAVVKQVDGRVKSLESNCNVLVRKNFFPKKLSTGGGGGRCFPKKNFHDHAGSIPALITLHTLHYAIYHPHHTPLVYCN
jgi:hypothetical protein